MAGAPKKMLRENKMVLDCGAVKAIQKHKLKMQFTFKIAL